MTNDSHNAQPDTSPITSCASFLVKSDDVGATFTLRQWLLYAAPHWDHHARSIENMLDHP